LAKIEKMKLVTLYRSALALTTVLFLSCTDKDDTPIQPVNNDVLVKKITETVYYGTESETSVGEFTYQSNVLTRIDVGPTYQEFVYVGDKISSVKQYANNVLATTQTLNYDGTKLLSIISDGASPERTDFIHNSNGLSAIEHKYFSGGEWITFQKDEYSFTAGSNIAERLRTSYLGGTSTSRSEYSYDSGNSPMRDMNPYFRLLSLYEGFDPKNQNNAVNQTSFTPADASAGVVYTYETTYNDLQFPTMIKRSAPDGTVISVTEIEYQ
jgi:hypothetical protein